MTCSFPSGSQVSLFLTCQWCTSSTGNAFLLSKYWYCHCNSQQMEQWVMGTTWYFWVKGFSYFQENLLNQCFISHFNLLFRQCLKSGCWLILPVSRLQECWIPVILSNSTSYKNFLRKLKGIEQFWQLKWYQGT